MNQRSLTPAYDQIEWQKKLDAINKCGKNYGPHDYIPIEWVSHNEDKAIDQVIQIKKVTKLMCRTCFVYVEVETLMKMYGEVKL